MIQNGTIYKNQTELPSIKVDLLSLDPTEDCKDKLGFTWACTDYTNEELSLKLYFDDYLCISASSNDGDKLSVTFYDQKLFVDISGKQIPPEYEISKALPR